MLEEDLARFDGVAEGGGRELTSALLDAAALPLPETQQLAEDLTRELDPQHLGIPWLEGLDTARRILLSDYATSAANTTVTNLFHSALHLLELREVSKAASDRVRYDPTLRPIPPGRPTLRGQLDDELAEMHIAGFLRGVGSALDCHAVPFAMLFALPCDVRHRFTFGAMRNSLRDSEPHRDLHNRFERWVADSGVPGWLDWTIDMRNAVVHAPRRLSLALLRSFIEGPPRLARLLPRTPKLTDVEVFRDTRTHTESYLQEDAVQTLEGVRASAVALLEQMSAAMREELTLRRDNPSPQPPSQWRKVEPPVRPDFRGYAPGSVQLPRGAAIMAHPVMTHRMSASSTQNDRQRRRWRSFYEEGEA